MKIRQSYLGLALGLIVAGFVGCSDDAVSPTSPSLAPPEQLPAPSVNDVRLRVAHLSPDAPPVDIIVNGNVTLTNVPYTAVSDYLELAAGDYRIQVTPAGDNTTSVIDATVTLRSGNVYTVAATGLLSAGDLQPLILRDDLSLGSGARVRFVHTGADAPGVDVAVAGGPVLFSDVTFRAASPYGEVDAGTYDLEVRVAGTQTVALEVPGVALSGGTTYTIFAIGLLGDGSLAALPVIDAP
jgi:hypothetical protein